MKEIIVESNVNNRIDSYLSELLEEFSRSNIQKMISEGNILVNDKRVKLSYKVLAGDKITINEVEPKETKLEAQDIPIEIIYQDDDIAVVNKPKGLVVHPGAGNLNGTLVNAMLYACKRKFIWYKW